MNKDETIHKLEILEMDFLRKNGINPDYNEVENHIENIFNLALDSVGITLDNLGISYIQYEEMVGDLEDKSNAIDSASCTLSNMKKIVWSMRKSDLKTTLLSYIEDMEMDLD